MRQRFIFICALFTTSTLASDLNVQSSVEVKGSHQTIQNDDLGVTNDLTTTEIIPSVSLNYESKRLNVNWSAKHTHVARDLNEDDRTDNYTEYLYDANFAVIENLLSLRARGTLNYLNANANGFITNDFLLSPDELSKTRSNSYGFVSNIRGNKYFSASAQGFYSDTQSEQRANSAINLSNDTINIQGSLRSGNGIEGLNWDVNSSFVETDRTNSTDFATRTFSANLSYRLLGDLGIKLSTLTEDNQIGDNSSDFSSLRRFESYGAGLEYRVNDSRYLAITYNIYNQPNESSEEDDDSEEDGYVGVEVNWAFSARTKLTGSYGKRFLGETGDVSFVYNTKNFRTRVSYNEELTTFSRSISNPVSIGVFVCSNNVIDLGSCFQPNSLAYQLKPGESFAQISGQNPEINDEIVIRQSFLAAVGFDRRRISVSLDGRYSLTDFLETNRQQRVWSVSADSVLAFGAYTDLKTSLRYSNTKQQAQGDVGIDGTSETLEGSIGLSRDIGQDLTVAGTLLYLEREGDNVGGIGGGALGGANIAERRFTLSLRYQIK